MDSGLNDDTMADDQMPHGNRNAIMDGTSANLASHYIGPASGHIRARSP